jgi:hypothetical protein
MFCCLQISSTGGIRMVRKTCQSATALIVALLMPHGVLAVRAQDTAKDYAVGIVYYSSGGDFKALEKEAAPQSGRSNYSARVKGAHASVRLRGDQPLVFRVCGADPSRFKLFRFKSQGDARIVTIAKNNIWIGGSKTVLSDSEIPVAIHPAEGNCFTMTPAKSLGDGEFGFSPLESLDAFMFGVGEVSEQGSH